MPTKPAGVVLQNQETISKGHKKKILKDLPAKDLKAAHAYELGHATKIAQRTVLLITFLTLIKGGAGYITNFIPLIGDAVGSSVDILAAIAIYTGLRLSQKRENQTFQYGYHRVETLSSFLISILIIYVGFEILGESVHRLEAPVISSRHEIGILVSFVSIFLSGYSFHIQKEVGEKIQSKALLASAYDKRNDMIVSGTVLIGIFADKMSIPYAQSILGIGISGLILFTGFSFGKDALLALLDYWDDPTITRQIQSILKKSKIITKIKKIRLRKAGTYIFGEAVVETHPFTEAIDLRNELNRIDRHIEESVKHLGDFVLYIHAEKPKKIRVALPVEKDIGLDSQIELHADHSYQFLFIDITDGKIHHVDHHSEMLQANDAVGIANFLKKNGANIYITSHLSPILYYNLRLNNIKVYPKFDGVNDVEETIKLLVLDI